MANKKPTFSPPKIKKTSATQSPADLVRGGRSKLTSSKREEKNVGGRPPLTEKVKRRDVALRKKDAQQLELLGPQWAIEAESENSIKVTPIVRSIVALMMPVLQNLDEIPTDEQHLREILADELEKGIDRALLEPILSSLGE